jgi:hypothetical protein
MRIQIKVFLEAEDEIDCEAQFPDYALVANDWDQAISRIGETQRKVELGIKEEPQETDDDSDNVLL